MVLNRVALDTEMIKLSISLSLLAFIPLLVIANEKGYTLLLVLAPLSYALLLIALFKKIKRPSAEIKGENLLIRNGLINEHVINRPLIESLIYEVGHVQRIIDPSASSFLGFKARKFINTEMHLLKVKLHGFSEWKIYINEVDNHIDDLRLYNFIKNHFYKVILSKKT
ncbi:hypothetical protein tinsulaeT_00200 [Thalassotalea insulae]|uniref:DUF304 domain-containing protein n=1 Tax=Thalassotalea insulae TaxID=2056778 RepID=A0ABQ6GKZ5_9GAMM|nr:hypothetical protein [Thalassotalea insulae]GLX76680.1 hypothetical protein tinsulaeT_00200 [Thalassotalea insulae]